MTKYHDSWSFIPNENSWCVPFYITFRDIFNSWKIQYFKSEGLCGWCLFLRMGPGRAGPFFSLHTVSGRGFVSAMCSLAHAPQWSLGCRSLSATGVRSRVCHAPTRAFDTVGCRVGYVVPWSGVFGATTKGHASCFFFVWKKLQK